MTGIKRAHVQRTGRGLELRMINDSEHIAIDTIKRERQTNRYRDAVAGPGERSCYRSGTGDGINAGTPFRNDGNAVGRNQFSFVRWQARLRRITVDTRIQTGVNTVLGIHAGCTARERARRTGTNGG